MKISTKGRYALRLMLDLALHDQGRPVRLKDVAARQEISVKYLESIASILAKAGYVRSLRGAQGGYLLKYRADQYKVGDILRLTEGSMVPVDCLETEENHCPRSGSCTTLRLWKELDTAVRSVIDHYTLADLVTWESKKETNTLSKRGFHEKPGSIKPGFSWNPFCILRKEIFAYR